MTPATVHHGHADSRHAERARVLDAAYARTPERFVRRAPTPPPVPTAAWINKPRHRGGRSLNPNATVSFDLTGSGRPATSALHDQTTVQGHLAVSADLDDTLHRAKGAAAQALAKCRLSTKGDTCRISRGSRAIDAGAHLGGVVGPARQLSCQFAEQALSIDRVPGEMRQRGVLPSRNAGSRVCHASCLDLLEQRCARWKLIEKRQARPPRSRYHVRRCRVNPCAASMRFMAVDDGDNDIAHKKSTAGTAECLRGSASSAHIRRFESSAGRVAVALDRGPRRPLVALVNEGTVPMEHRHSSNAGDGRPHPEGTQPWRESVDRLPGQGQVCRYVQRVVEEEREFQLIDTLERATAIRAASKLREPYMRMVLQQLPNGVHEPCSPRVGFTWHPSSLVNEPTRPRPMRNRPRSAPMSDASTRLRGWLARPFDAPPLVAVTEIGKRIVTCPSGGVHRPDRDSQHANPAGHSEPVQTEQRAGQRREPDHEVQHSRREGEELRHAPQTTLAASAPGQTQSLVRRRLEHSGGRRRTSCRRRQGR